MSKLFYSLILILEFCACTPDIHQPENSKPLTKPVSVPVIDKNLVEGFEAIDASLSPSKRLLDIDRGSYFLRLGDYLGWKDVLFPVTYKNQVTKATVGEKVYQAFKFNEEAYPNKKHVDMLIHGPGLFARGAKVAPATLKEKGGFSPLGVGLDLIDHRRDSANSAMLSSTISREFSKITANWPVVSGVSPEAWVYVFEKENGISLTLKSRANKQDEHEVTFVGNIDWANVLGYRQVKRDKGSEIFVGPLYLRKNIGTVEKESVVDFLTDFNEAELSARKERAQSNRLHSNRPIPDV